MTTTAMPAIMPAGQWHGAFNQFNQAQIDSLDTLHNLAWQAINHAKVHGDTSLLVRMLNEQPNNARTDALAQRVKKLTPVNVMQRREGGQPVLGEYGRPLVVASLRKKRTEADWKLEEAYALAFFNMTKPKSDAGFQFQSFTDMVRAYITKADKATAKGKLTAEQIEKVRLEKAAAMAVLVQVTGTPQAA